MSRVYRRGTRRGLFVVLAFALLYIILAPVVMKPLYYAILFAPDPFTKRKCNLTELRKSLGYRPQEVKLPESGAQLDALYFKNPMAKYTLLYCHQQGYCMTQCLEEVIMLSQKGVSVLTFDYKGMGKSTGTPSVAGLEEDSVAAYDYLVKRAGVPAEKIIVFGTSLGTGPAAAVAASKVCKGVVLVSPYVSLIAATKRALPHLLLYPDWLFPERDLSCLQAAREFNSPALIAHGTKDSLIPYREGREVFAAIPCQKEFLSIIGFGHSNYHEFANAGQSSLGQKLIDKVACFVDGLDRPGTPSNAELKLNARKQSWF